MRYLILSDIHANLDALEAVLQAAAASYDRVVVLGDLVGYGPEPNEVIDRVRALDPVAIIRGNHDKVAAGIEDSEGFNAIAQRAASWTLGRLTPQNRDYLVSLPAGPLSLDPLAEICHGAPFDEDAYIFSELDALRALRLSRRQVCLFGHTHFPVVFRLSDTGFDVLTERGESELEVPLEKGVKYLINPGAVGQPRDGDPRAAYGLLDEERRRMKLFRAQYPLEAAQAKVIRAGLPPALAERLAAGR
jgi:predicted phosphodiesterase